MQKIHILGIAGHAMRGVAHAAQLLGNQVTGTDEQANGKVPQLDEWGITWWRDPDAAHLDKVDLLIVGGGIPADHLELVEAQKRGIKIQSYPQFIASLIQGAHRIVVTGTHGKTTTTALITWILESAGQKPDYLIGIKPNNFESSVRLAGSKVVVIEGDEYRSSQLDDQSKFSYYKPDVAVITSIEHDHPDLFPDLAAVEERFVGLVKRLPRDGQLYYWSGDANVCEVIKESTAPAQSYGLQDADWTATDVKFTPRGIEFNLIEQGTNHGRLSVGTYGEHNVLNALAASAVALGEGLTFEQLQESMRTFKGASRRFEKVSVPDAEITVIDDYAHHPTEVAATINAARRHFKGRVIAVFRPHTYSRTQALMSEYQLAFEESDQTFIADIEAARESGAGSVSSAQIAEGAGKHVVYEPDRTKLVESVVAEAKPGDVVLCMTVSGYDDLAQELASKLQ